MPLLEKSSVVAEKWRSERRLEASISSISPSFKTKPQTSDGQKPFPLPKGGSSNPGSTSYAAAVLGTAAELSRIRIKLIEHGFYNFSDRSKKLIVHTID
jgi:hypothetical protein